MTNGNLARLESIPNGKDLGNDNEEMVENVFHNPFGNQDSPDVVATPPQNSPNMAATPLEGIPNVATTPPQENVAKSDNVSQIHPLVEPYTNVMQFYHGFSFSDDNDAGSGDKKSRSKGVYRPSGISYKIEEYQIFKLKKDVNMTLSIISIHENFQFKTFKPNTHFTVIYCMDTSCS